MMNKKLVLSMAIFITLLFAQECSYKKVFGFAKIQKIEDNNASISFTIQDGSGRRSLYENPFTIVAPLGIKAKETYPAILHIRQTGECEKHKILIIQEIGTACRVK